MRASIRTESAPTPQTIVERNRRNAARSTGPRTEDGKARARWNALKHGLLCREIIIPDGDGKESRTKLAHLISELRSDLEPVGVLEEMMVEKIAGCYWRLRRVMRAEIGEIKKRLVLSGPRAAAQTELRPVQNAMLDLNLLDQVRTDVERDGGPRPEDLEKFRNFRLAAHSPEVIEVLDQVLSAYAAPEEADDDDAPAQDDDDTHAQEAGGGDARSQDDAAAAARRRARLLKLIDSRRRIQRRVIDDETDRGREKYEEHLDAALARYHLPDRSASMRLRLYEGSINRELHRAMRELRELQAGRQRSSRHLRQAEKNEKSEFAKTNPDSNGVEMPESA